MIARILAIVGVLALVLASCSSSSEPGEASSAPPGFRGLFEGDAAPPPPALNVYKIAAGGGSTQRTALRATEATYREIRTG